jgi:NADH:ubiquinone oxidoreductase subunit 6 (subunit J)
MHVVIILLCAMWTIDIYKLSVTNKETIHFIAILATTLINNAKLWHLCLGHINQN